jgi:fimbrial chaperone protein
MIKTAFHPAVCRLCAGLVTALLLANNVAEAQVLISPVAVELNARQRIATVTVTLSESARAPLRLQAGLQTWTQDIHGANTGEPSEDLLIIPAIAELKPGDKQVFRLALRRPGASTHELAYRLVLEDLNEPSATIDAGSGMSIFYRMRYDLPIMLAPVEKLATNIRWKPCIAANSADGVSVQPGAKKCVRLVNAGNKRVKVASVILHGDDWQQTLPMHHESVILAGAARELTYAALPGQAGKLAAVQLNTSNGAVSAQSADL